VYYRDHISSTILFLVESHLDLSYRYCNTKVHNGKSRYRQYKFQQSFQYEYVTSHWHLLRLHARIHPGLSTMLQDNVMSLSKFLLTGYQFSSVRIPIEYVVVLRCV